MLLTNPSRAASPHIHGHVMTLPPGRSSSSGTQPSRVDRAGKADPECVTPLFLHNGTCRSAPRLRLPIVESDVGRARRVRLQDAEGDAVERRVDAGRLAPPADGTR
jgi:hypothetical protein